MVIPSPYRGPQPNTEGAKPRWEVAAPHPGDPPFHTQRVPAPHPPSDPGGPPALHPDSGGSPAPHLDPQGVPSPCKRTPSLYLENPALHPQSLRDPSPTLRGSTSASRSRGSPIHIPGPTNSHAGGGRVSNPNSDPGGSHSHSWASQPHTVGSQPHNGAIPPPHLGNPPATHPQHRRPQSHIGGVPTPD